MRLKKSSTRRSSHSPSNSYNTYHFSVITSIAFGFISQKQVLFAFMSAYCFAAIRKYAVQLIRTAPLFCPIHPRIIVKTKQRGFDFMTNKNSPCFVTTLNDRSEGMDPRTYLLNRKRTIWLGSAIDEESAFYTASAISFLADKSTEEITLYINSPGGCVSDGLVIYDAMLSSGCSIKTIATGVAASMGAFLLAAGTKRFATPSAKILLHQPFGGVQGQVSDILIAAENINKTKMQLAALLSKHTGQKLKKITDDLDRDMWFTAEEAIAYGIIDSIAA